jgi:hypothetical protein
VETTQGTVEVGAPAQELSQSARAWMQLKLLLALVLEKLCYHARFPRGLKAFSTPPLLDSEASGVTFSCSSPSRFNEQEVYLMLYSVSMGRSVSEQIRGKMSYWDPVWYDHFGKAFCWTGV